MPNIEKDHMPWKLLGINAPDIWPHVVLPLRFGIWDGVCLIEGVKHIHKRLVQRMNYELSL